MTVATPTPAPKAAVNSAQQFRNRADKIAELQLELQRIDAEIADRVKAIKAEFPDQAKLQKKCEEYTRQCADWFFADPANRDAVLADGKKSGSTQICAWKLILGRPTVEPQEGTTIDEVIQSIESAWRGSGAIREKKELAKSVLATWSDDDLALVGLCRVPPRETLKFEPLG